MNLFYSGTQSPVVLVDGRWLPSVVMCLSVMMNGMTKDNDDVEDNLCHTKTTSSTGFLDVEPWNCTHRFSMKNMPWVSVLR